METHTMRTRRTKNESNKTVIKTGLSYDDLMGETKQYEPVKNRIEVPKDIMKFIIDARDKKNLSYENISNILTDKGFVCGKDFVRLHYKNKKRS